MDHYRILSLLYRQRRRSKGNQRLFNEELARLETALFFQVKLTGICPAVAGLIFDTTSVISPFDTSESAKINVYVWRKLRAVIKRSSRKFKLPRGHWSSSTTISFKGETT